MWPVIGLLYVTLLALKDLNVSAYGSSVLIAVDCLKSNYLVVSNVLLIDITPAVVVCL